MTLTCTRYKCGNKANIIIVYGCLNQHLAETWLCHPHYQKWTRTEHRCYTCDDLITDAEMTTVEWVKITNPEILNELNNQL